MRRVENVGLESSAWGTCSTCVGLARLAPYHLGPNRLRLLEQVAKRASVSVNCLAVVLYVSSGKW